MVAHFVRDEGVAGSNPVIPIDAIQYTDLLAAELSFGLLVNLFVNLGNAAIAGELFNLFAGRWAHEKGNFLEALFGSRGPVHGHSGCSDRL